MHKKKCVFGGKQILIRIYIVSGILVTMNNYKMYSICSIYIKQILHSEVPKRYTVCKIYNSVHWGS